MQAQTVTHDSTFNQVGYSHDIDPSSETEFREVKVYPDGTIITVGLINYSGLILAKYLADGTLDGSFGTNGFTTYGISGYYYRTYSMIALEDYKILVCGEYVDGYFFKDFLARFNSDGSIDNTFGVNGVAPIIHENGASSIFNIDLQADGKIIAVGQYTNLAQDSVSSYIARFNANGSPDLTFAADGIYETGFSVILNDAKVQDDGNIIAIGSSVDENSIPYLYALRLHSDGSPDNSFSGDGVFQFNIPSHQVPYSCSAALQPDGKIVFNGTTRNVGTFAPIVILGRLNTDGTLDLTFNNVGYTFNNINSDNSYALDIALQPDGKIITSGNAYNNSESSDQFISRHLADGTIDSSFNTIGYLNQFIPWEDNYNTSFELQPDGKIVYVGTEVSTSFLKSFIGRLNNETFPSVIPPSVAGISFRVSCSGR
jgi:uncharacterized delta-60 repeat protein